MSSAAELIVTLNGKDVGLKALLTALERDLKKADAAATKTAAAMESDLAAAQDKAALSAARLAQAEARTVGELLKNEAAMNRAALSALRLQQATEKAAKPPGKGLAGFFADIKDQAASAALGMASFGAAVGTAAAIAQSFKDAFALKAELDATTASINIQLQGVRDSGQVWSDAATYANKYKLTQQETAATVQASIGILRNSKASVEDTFGVLQRLTVLAPGKSIADAAFSVRELASGDITSIAEQFNISRTKAYEMRDAINSGADVVTVLSGFLDGAGVSMDALKVKTEGAMGAMADLKLANEQLALAQGELASGPGIAFLQTQAAAITGLSRALKGELIPSWEEVSVKAAVYNEAFQAAMRTNGGNVFLSQAAGLAAVADQSKLAAEAAKQHAAAEGERATAVDLVGPAVQRAADAAALATAANAMFANGANGAATAAQAQAQNTGAAAIAAAEQATQAQAAASALGDMLTATLSEADAAEAAEAQARAFSAAQEQIANLGGAVHSGLMTAAEAAALLARQYNITTGEAERLIDAQARIAGGAQRLADQKLQTRELVPGGVGVSSPGKRGQSDADILATVTKATEEITAVGVRAQPVRTAAVKAGGAARVKAEQATSDTLLDAARDYQSAIAQIEADGLKKRQAAERSLQSAQLNSRAGFYAGLANIEDNALRQDLSARYEAAAVEAGKIAQTQGADAAQKYLEASRQQIEGESQIQQQIKEARDAGDAGQAAYLEGVLALQQAANADELALISEQADAALAAEQARYTAAEAQYAEHLAKMGGIAAANGTTLGATLPNAPIPLGGAATGSAPPAATTGKPTPVVDLATPAAVDANGARTEGKLSELAGILESIKGEIGALRGDVRSLKQSRAAG